MTSKGARMEKALHSLTSADTNRARSPVVRPIFRIEVAAGALDPHSWFPFWGFLVPPIVLCEQPLFNDNPTKRDPLLPLAAKMAVRRLKRKAMSTTVRLSENSHQGFEAAKRMLCLAELEAKPKNALGMPLCLRQNRVGSRCSGKERDAESGLDYFGTRYYSGAQGRFTSPDLPLLDQYRIDPQSWNLYVYARNNPLRYIDPTGNAIELLGDEEERKKALAFLQKSIGNKEAASRLYINTVKDGDTTRYFVGIRGDVGEFMKLSNTAHDLANVVEHKNVVEFGLTAQDLSGSGGAVAYEKGKHGNQNVRVLVNPEQTYVANRVLHPATVLGYSRFEGQEQSPSWRINPFTPEVMAWHEFGHAWGMIHGRANAETNPEAFDWENRMREQLYGPLGPKNARRIRH